MNRIQVHNVRLGFATNSSSSHSLIFLKNQPRDDFGSDSGYGWAQFTLSSGAAKTDYLAQALYQNLKGELGEHIASLVVKEWCGIRPNPDGYIDHQSLWDLPRSWDDHGVDQEFFADLKSFILQDGLTILGGNDNDGCHPLADNTEFRLRLSESPSVARKDPSGVWTIFSRQTGAKIRLSFEDPSNTPPAPKRSALPELVDLKITDHCDRGCKYCYQDSRPDGKHASVYDVREVLDALAELRVFEVAIGGGEPMLHPDFMQILRYAKKVGITPNFTTRDRAWLRTEQAKEIAELVGAVGISVENARDVTDIATVLDYHNLRNKLRVTVQAIVGALDAYALEYIARECSERGLPLLLLGFKSVGRGYEFAKSRMIADQTKSSDWIDHVIKGLNGASSVSIDTALAQQFGKELAPHLAGNRGDGTNIFYATEEGAYSMYIDAVTGMMAPSSYCDLAQSVPFQNDCNADSTADQIRKAFAEMGTGCAQ